MKLVLCAKAAVDAQAEDARNTAEAAVAAVAAIISRALPFLR